MCKLLTTLILLVICVLVRCFCAQSTLDDTAIKSIVAKSAQKGNIVGMAVVFFKKSNNQVKYITFGYQNKDNICTIDLDTPFELASLSKSFTGLAIAKLTLQGKLKLNDPVLEYVPNLVPNYKKNPVKITIKNLLQHSTGIPWYTISLFDQIKSYSALAKVISEINLNFTPGSNFEYSTVNYALLGAVIEKISGKSFSLFMKHEIFAPLGMFDSSFPDTAVDCTGYKINFCNACIYNAPSYELNYPSAYLVSTIKDMCTWLKLQINACQASTNIIEQAAYITQQKLDEMIADPEYQNHYGMGWYIMPNGDFNHTGLNPNFATYISFNKDVGVVVLSNTASYMTYAIGDFLFSWLKGNDSNSLRMYNFTSEIDNIFSIICLLFVFFHIVIYLLYNNGKIFISIKDCCNSMLKICIILFPIISPIYILYYFKISYRTIVIWYPLSLFCLWFLIILTCLISCSLRMRSK